MEFIIEDSSTLGEIKHQFTHNFPFLKLEFFKSNSDHKALFSPENKISNEDVSLHQISSLKEESLIFVNAEQSVGSLEKQFLNTFDVLVQVFRKSGAIWLLTDASDDWSLRKQNEAAAEMNEAVPKENSIDFDAYHEQI